jgi:hypothetical protein
MIRAKVIDLTASLLMQALSLAKDKSELLTLLSFMLLQGI